jgi:dolichol-phosphate mannosyltransferase
MVSDALEKQVSRSFSGTIVVGGACGFVGANVCRYFSARGATVWAVDGPSGNDWRLRDLPGVNRVRLDLRSRADVHDFIAREAPSAVINCSAYGGYASQSEPDRIYAVNFSAVRFLLEAVAELPNFTAFVQMGSSSEYGLNCTAPSEQSPTLPDSDYSVSKVAASAVTQLYGLKHRVPTWVLRLYSVYGPYEDFSRLIPNLLLSAKERTFPKLVNPAISRDFVFVDDVCEAVERVLVNARQLRYGEIYNIGTGVRSRLGELVSLVQTTFDVPGEPVWGSMPDRHWDHPDWFADPRKAKEHLSWSARTSLREGLLATMRWLQNNPQLVVEGQKSSVIAAPRS